MEKDSRDSYERYLEEVTLSDGGTSEPKTKLAWSRESSDELEDLNSHFRFKWQFFRKLYDTFFIIDNQAFQWAGHCPNFEKAELFDKCKSYSFSFSRLFWERVFKDTRPLNSSIRAKKFR